MSTQYHHHVILKLATLLLRITSHVWFWSDFAKECQICVVWMVEILFSRGYGKQMNVNITAASQRSSENDLLHGCRLRLPGCFPRHSEGCSNIQESFGRPPGLVLQAEVLGFDFNEFSFRFSGIFPHPSALSTIT